MDGRIPSTPSPRRARTLSAGRQRTVFLAHVARQTLLGYAVVPKTTRPPDRNNRKAARSLEHACYMLERGPATKSQHSEAPVHAQRRGSRCIRAGVLDQDGRGTSVRVPASLAKPAEGPSYGNRASGGSSARVQPSQLYHYARLPLIQQNSCGPCLPKSHEDSSKCLQCPCGYAIFMFPGSGSMCT